MRARQFIREITSTLPPGKEPMGMDPEVATEPIQQANTQAITPTIKKTKCVLSKLRSLNFVILLGKD